MTDKYNSDERTMLPKYFRFFLTISLFKKTLSYKMFMLTFLKETLSKDFHVLFKFIKSIGKVTKQM